MIELAPLFVGAGARIFMLHDSDPLFRRFCFSGCASDETFFILNYAWFMNARKRDAIQTMFREIVASTALSLDYLAAHCLFLMNSEEERAFFTDAFRAFRCEVVSNCFTLSEDVYTLTNGKRRFDAVYNARPYAFKRHYLASDVPRLCLISYDPGNARSDPHFSDISTIPRKGMYWNIDDRGVCAVLNRAGCGLLRSAEEGACYASAEDLLCGLPVVSTDSRGGRHEYYNADNSIIADATPEAIRSAVSAIRDGEKNGRFDRRKIRALAVARQKAYRALLSAAVSRLAGINEATFSVYLDNAIRADTKLLRHANYWRS